MRARKEEGSNFILGAGSEIAACGYIYTTYGVVVNCKETFELAVMKRDLDVAKERAAQQKRFQA